MQEVGFSIKPVPELRNGDGMLVPDMYQGRWQPRILEQYTYTFMRRGKVSACHYHDYEDPSKRPERLHIISGQIALRLLYLDGEEVCHVLEGRFGHVLEVTIDPFVWHETECLSKTAILLELRETVFDSRRPSTFKCTRAEFLAQMAVRADRLRERDAMSV